MARIPSPGPARPVGTPAATDAVAAAGRQRWLLFVHQLPSTSSNLRVRTWRRLQQIGALPLKQAVYVLPDSRDAREDFEWLKAEVTGAGGEASVFSADHVDTWSDDALVEEFRRARQEAYAALATELEQALGRTGRSRGRPRPPHAADRATEAFRQRLAAIERIDFFGSAGRDRVASLLKALEERDARGRQPAAPHPTSDAVDAPSYEGRLWVTRPRPGVDRMASAWLIRRFIDPQARFGFAADRQAVADAGIPFDMFGGEFTHEGDRCTFETLCHRFAMQDPAVARLAAIVHDLDLKDARFGAAEAETVGALITGLQLAHADDDELLAQGMTMFEALYRTFDRSARTSGPRGVARAKPGRKGGRRASRARKR